MKRCLYLPLIALIVCAFCVVCGQKLQAQPTSTSEKTQNAPSVPKAAKKTSKSKKIQYSPAQDTANYDAYTGKWYGLYYPFGWKIRPSLRGNDGADDSVFFTAPDSSAEFYVYCPRYSGKPTDIEVNTATEEQLGQTLEEKDGVRIRTVRIKAKDGSYSRVFEDTVAFMAGRRLVFGFKFRGAKALAFFDPFYLFFKQSFRKFAD